MYHSEFIPISKNPTAPLLYPFFVAILHTSESVLHRALLCSRNSPLIIGVGPNNAFPFIHNDETGSEPFYLSSIPLCPKLRTWAVPRVSHAHDPAVHWSLPPQPNLFGGPNDTLATSHIHLSALQMSGTGTQDRKQGDTCTHKSYVIIS